jgi:hypothetical protein
MRRIHPDNQRPDVCATRGVTSAPAVSVRPIWLGNGRDLLALGERTRI